METGTTFDPIEDVSIEDIEDAFTADEISGGELAAAIASDILERCDRDMAAGVLALAAAVVCRATERPIEDFVASLRETDQALTEEALRLMFAGRTCRVCGCTDLDCSRCVVKTGQPCQWVEDDLCSACDLQGGLRRTR